MTATQIVREIVKAGGKPFLRKVRREINCYLWPAGKIGELDPPQDAPPGLSMQMLRWRYANKLTVIEAAKRAGVSENTWRLYEKQHRTRGCAAMRKIVEKVNGLPRP